MTWTSWRSTYDYSAFNSAFMVQWAKDQAETASSFLCLAKQTPLFCGNIHKLRLQKPKCVFKLHAGAGWLISLLILLSLSWFLVFSGIYELNIRQKQQTPIFENFFGLCLRNQTRLRLPENCPTTTSLIDYFQTISWRLLNKYCINISWKLGLKKTLGQTNKNFSSDCKVHVF